MDTDGDRHLQRRRHAVHADVVRGQLLGHDMTKLRRELEQSRDYIFEKAGVQQDLFA